MKLVKIKELESHTSPNHFKTLTRRVIGGNVNAKNVQVSLAVVEKGGGANMHTHEKAEHIFYMIEGKLQIKSHKQQVELEEGMAVFIPPGEPHLPHNPYDKKAVYLVINSPPE